MKLVLDLIKYDYDKSVWQYNQRDDIFTGGTYSSGEMCMKRSPMPDGFIDDSKIIGNENKDDSNSLATVSNKLSTNKLNNKSTLKLSNNSNNINIEKDSINTTTISNIIDNDKDKEEPIILKVDNNESNDEVVYDGTVLSTEPIDKKSLLSNPDWNLISSMVKDNTIKNIFEVGDTFNSTILYNDSSKKYPWIIADFKTIKDHDDIEHNAMILIAKYAAISKLPFDNGLDNRYDYSIIKQYLNSSSNDINWFNLQFNNDVEYIPDIVSFQSTLPKEFIDVVGDVKNKGKFWIPSLTEMNVNILEENESPLQYFINLSNNEKIEIGSINNNYKFKRANAISTAVTYWTRTLKSDTTNAVYVCFASNGSINSNVTNDLFAIVPICAIF